MHFQTPWYLWPLVSPLHGWLMCAAGLISLVAIQFLASRGQRAEEEQESPPPPGTAQVEGRSVTKVFFVGLFVVLASSGLAWWWFGLDHTVIGPILIMVVWSGMFGMIIFMKFKNIQAERAVREAGSADGSAGTGLISNSAGSHRPNESAWAAWEARRAKPPADKGYRQLVVMIITALIALYGAAGFVLPAFLASSIIPADWEWPMPRQSSVLELPDGRRAGVQSSASRVQVYDASGNYLTGWYLSNGGTILGPGPARPGEPESIEVQISDQKITFDLQGRELGREELPDYSPLPTTGNFVEMEFSTPFYLLPLTNPILCWFMGLVGIIGVGSARVRPVRVVNSQRKL